MPEMPGTCEPLAALTERPPANAEPAQKKESRSAQVTNGAICRRDQRPSHDTDARLMSASVISLDEVRPASIEHGSGSFH